MVFESAESLAVVRGRRSARSRRRSSSYGFQKLAVEYFARAARDQYELPYTIVRPFNCVGIGESRALGDVEVLSGNVKLAMSHVVPDLVQKVLKGQDPLHILGDGTQVRHYTYGGDLARGHRRPRWSTRPRSNEDFNLSTAESTTVLELAELIWREDQGPRRAVPLRVTTTPFEHDVQRRVPATEKAKRRARLRGDDHARRDARRGHPLDPPGHRGRPHLTVPPADQAGTPAAGLV